MVKDVENVRAGTAIVTLSGNGEVLHSGEVKLEVARPTQSIASDGSDCAAGSPVVRRFDGKGVDVVLEPGQRWFRNPQGLTWHVIWRTGLPKKPLTSEMFVGRPDRV